MLNTILGSKQKMGQTFVEDTRVPVTHVKAGPCVVIQIKKEGSNGYWAVQLGFGTKRIKNITKPMQGHLKAAYKGKKAARFLREVRLEKKPDCKVGDTINVSDIFKKGDLVSVTGISKGKGFTGAIKRWGFAMGPRTHGQSDRLRAPGSIGAMGIGRVHKGKKMAGRVGTQKTTVKNLVVVGLNGEENELMLSGPVPGIPGGLLIIRKLASGKLDRLVGGNVQAQVMEDRVSSKKPAGAASVKKDESEQGSDKKPATTENTEGEKK